MGHRYAVVGVGRMGQAIAWWLSGREDTELVRLIDTSMLGIAEFKQRFQDVGGCKKAVYLVQDGALEESLINMVRDVDVAILACGYLHHLQWTRRCIKAGAHVVDLGGNRAVVGDQKRLSGDARSAGVTVIPDQGIAPGLVSLLAMDTVMTLEADYGCADETMNVKMMVGGLPIDPGTPENNPLRYLLNWSSSGLVNEYVEPVEEVRKHRLVTVEPLTDLESVTCFDERFGNLEAFTTSGGAGNLPSMLDRSVESVCYKTIRHEGHHAALMVLKRLGLFDNTYYLNSGGTPRVMLRHLIDRNLKNEGEDVILAYVEVAAWRDCPCAQACHGENVAAAQRLIVESDPETGFSAMARATAFPAAAIAEQLADGTIKERGVVNGETAINLHALERSVSERGGIEVEAVLWPSLSY